MLTQAKAIDQTKLMLGVRNGEAARLDKIYKYLRNEQELHWVATQVPDEVRRLARISRVNFLPFVSSSVVQAMYVDGYRARRESDNQPAWEAWQRNKMDGRQIGIHRATVNYGAAYESVLPGDIAPVMRGLSPRYCTTLYTDDDDWPTWALEKRKSSTDDGKKLYRLFDDTWSYWLSVGDYSDSIEFVSQEEHGAGVVPIVRFRDTFDLDNEATGEIEPLISLQDQINVTTFGLLVGQHYGAFKQRYILGWLAETEETKLRAEASKLWTFIDHPDDIQVGEFSQTDLKGYLESREATLRHLATVSQTPAHELLGQLVNLSAEALAAAESSHRRKIVSYQTCIGEAHEQSLELVSAYMGVKIEPEAYVRWKDTEARSLAQMADALGKLVQMLGVPAQELWERIPGVTQTEIERWKATASEGDPLALMNAELARQAGGNPAPEPAPAG